MNRNFSEELISAYLDDRVTADERVRVEQALAESAELRRLHSDLQRVQSGLRQLPRFSLSPDFAGRVVQRIEREAPRRSIATPPPVQPVSDARETKETQRSWKSVAAAAASLAAALLIALLWLSSRNPLPESGQPASPVASNPVNPRPAESLAGRERTLPDGSHLVAGMNEFQAAGPTYVLVVDLAITPEGQQQQVFQQALQGAGIQFNPEVGVDEVLEKALLASRFIGDVQVVVPTDRGNEKPVRDEIEMFYVTGVGEQIEAAIQDLRERPKHHIARQPYFDMAIEPAERKLFEQLNSAVRMADSRRTGPGPQAYRLSFRFSLRSGSAGFLGTFSRPLIQAEVVPVEEQAAAPAATARKAGPSSGSRDSIRPIAAELPAAGNLADVNDDENTVYEVLFIVRNLQ